MKWQKQAYDDLIPAAKSDFRCARCDTMQPWQECWASTSDNICSICTACRDEEAEK